MLVSSMKVLQKSTLTLTKRLCYSTASLESFVPHKITTLFGLITAGEDFYRSIGVKTKGEAEAVWQKSHHQPAVREQVEELLKLENEWDSFLLSLDKGLQMTDEQLSGAKTVDSLSPDSLFTDARSGKSVTLGQFLGQGQKLLLVLVGHLGWLP
ncbi:hypothetical protein XENORESO_010124 [Xenotaenia resolanae]|uniref:Selenoprotein L n=1 Tax=Xenotaenia resolanae TaxID=208358 RepID=A0ABV0XAM3_9TELE